MKGIVLMNIDWNNVLYAFIVALIVVVVVPKFKNKNKQNDGNTKKSLFSKMITGNESNKSNKPNSLNNKVNADKNNKAIQGNGTKRELTTFLSSLLTFARKNKISIVYPGTVAEGDKIASLLLLVVTRSKVIGVNCFGFGGTVRPNEEAPKGEWKQTLNGEENSIRNPIMSSLEQKDIVRKVMDDNFMKEIDLEVAAVFTNSKVDIINDGNNEKLDNIYTVREFMLYLKQLVLNEDRDIEPISIAKKINEHVKKIKA